MAYQFSDSDTSDSESGIRFKTDSTRNKNSKARDASLKKSSRSHRSRDREREERSPRRYRRSRSSPDRKRNYSDHRRDVRKTHETELQSQDDEYRRYTKRKKHKDDFSDSSENSDKNKTYKKSSHRKKKSKKSKHKDRPKDERETSCSSSRDDKHSTKKHVKNDSCRSFAEETNHRPNVAAEVSSKPLTSGESGKRFDKTVVDEYGPLLPPHLVKKVSPTLYDNVSSNSQESPPFVNSGTDKESDCETYGPSLPPKLTSKTDNASSSVTTSSPVKKIVGPALPTQTPIRQFPTAVDDVGSEASDEEIIGPLPADNETNSRARIELEERALEMKLNKLSSNESKVKVREEWMTELPEVQAVKLGLGPRQFKTREGPDFSDRSTWTDTPEDKEKKAGSQSSGNEKVDLKQEALLKQIEQKNLEQEEIVNRLNADKTESLLDIHRKKMKEKKKTKAKSNERRPFDRDVDLKINRFDEAQKNAIFKKAQLLNDRFSQGKSKFL